MPTERPRDPLCETLAALDPRNTEYATRFVDLVLQAACARQASDVHLQPTAEGLLLRWRLDGVLHELGRFPSGDAADVVSRLKVLAELLTYRHDMPQEGRIRRAPQDIEMRVSTFPTLHGERAVVRLFATERRLLYPEDLGFPADLSETLLRLVSESSGAVLITGPAGSGKTTTAYALLRHVARLSAGQKSLVSLEDPIEAAVEGVAQSQINPGAGFDFATGLRSLMRQDPEVVLVGEIRDRVTAETAYQAALTGHLVLTTFHAGSAAGAVSRLTDMGIEPYLLRSGTLGILSQRLVRTLCDCARESEDPADRLGLPVRQCRLAAGCPQCGLSGYRGRQVLAELLPLTPDAVGRAILSRTDTAQIEGLAVQAGMVTRWERAAQAVEAGETSPAEIRRVLGCGDGKAPAAQ